MNKKTIRDVDVTNKKVLVRCDFNVPLDKETGKITNDLRIVAALPTIKYLLENNAKVILCSHLGKPKGEIKPELSLKPVANRLSEYLGFEVKFSKDIVGENAKELSKELKPGKAILLENVRFDPREEKNDKEFSKELASLAEIYVNDAFGTAHRAHSSTVGVAEFLPAVCGFLIEKEVEMLGDNLNNPERPFVAILGGAKVSDKIKVIENLLEKVDSIIIGGGMTYTFLKAMGYEIGNSICELDRIDIAKETIEKAEKKGVKLLFPIDTVCGKEFSNEAETIVVDSKEIPKGWQGLDIGPKAIEEFTQVLKNAKTVIWNGPLGVFEFEKFAKGTNAIAKVLSEINAITIVGGGDSVAAVEKGGFSDKITHISTGGGATLEYLEGKELPGIECLENK
ncbi:phosphoglycerate kinase [Clostridium sp. CAG:798]|jgi:phosphoglycerate kinase|nr:phosphoglycerate kinase [Clostridium sp. CAG:798]HBJ12293.1 phosphoglycerate kinase [Clostridiales bacterium]